MTKKQRKKKRKFSIIRMMPTMCISDFPSRTGRRGTVVFTRDDFIVSPGARVILGSNRLLERVDPSKPRDVRLGEMFAKLYWGHRKLGGIRQAGRFPDIEALDLRTGETVTLELTELAYERDQIRRRRTEGLKAATYRAVVADRPLYRGWAICVRFKLGETAMLPSERGEEGRRFVDELVRLVRQSFKSGEYTESTAAFPNPDMPPSYERRLHLDEQEYPTLAKYVAEINLVPNSSEDDRLPAPDDPLVILGTQLRVYVEGQAPELIRYAVGRKASRGPSYRADILLVHTWTDPYVLAAPEGMDTVIAEGQRAVREVGAHLRFGEVWLMDTLYERIWRLFP